ncbi:nitrous oxide reductase family maturation protein NosD [Kitasatospora sp. NPDC057223]|uniref:right-handed parallel beta-helix repeat-containing protein n=1 Tax=Kitasatospora sp. NPDC057223 TaxID=3346055 RepID=UPI0036263395
MSTRRVTHLAAATATAAALITLGAVPPAHASARHLVRPGESVQQAVDAAAPGDTVQLLPGSYQGSVLVTTSGLTIRGAGPETVITPGADDANACALAGHGICVTGAAGHRLTGVRIEALTVSGFRKNGVNASETDGMAVRAVRVQGNGQQGISQEKSTRGMLTGNEATGNGQSGIFLANTVDNEGGAIDTEGAVIRENRLEGNRIGVTVRRARDLTVERNAISGNCGGVFIVGDEGVPRAGALTISRNKVTANNKYCPPNPRLDAIQGTGILLTGAEDTLVSGNQVEGNVGGSSMSGGIVLFRSVVGVPNTRITVSGNHVSGNGPADLADRDTGADNVFTRNHCAVSEPAGHC